MGRRRRQAVAFGPGPTRCGPESGATRLLRAGLAIAFSLVVAACGGDDSGPDPEAFCQLLEQGVGIGSDEAEVNPADFARLARVAPVEIESAIQKLANTARSLEEIPDDDLGQLFAAAFDPDAQSARIELLGYADDECGIDTSGITDGRILSDLEVRAELRGFLEDNFASEGWLEDVDYDFRRSNANLDSIRVDFTTAPEVRDDALDACNAVSVFLYEVKSGGGSVTVVHETDPLAERAGPDEACIVR